LILKHVTTVISKQASVKRPPIVQLQDTDETDNTGFSSRNTVVIFPARILGPDIKLASMISDLDLIAIEAMSTQIWRWLLEIGRKKIEAMLNFGNGTAFSS
jgi:hypothetical protein